MKHFTWSWSRLRNYETCPKRHYHYDIAKDVEEVGGFNDGQAAHSAYEQRIRIGKKLPLGLTHQEPILARLAALPGEHYAEQKLALTSEFKPTGFFSANVWFRTVIDFCAVAGKTAAVVDYKTGKPAPDTTQLQLMSATVMHYDPAIEEVRARLLFMNHNSAEKAVYSRNDIPGIWGNILPRVRQLQKAQVNQDYPPKPSGLCVRYCGITSCPFYGRGSR